MLKMYIYKKATQRADVVEKLKKVRKVSNTVWVLLERYDSREHINKRDEL
jgi:hypothetical protein